MDETQIAGVAPQNSATDAPGVVLTRTEQAFLTLLCDPLALDPEVMEAAQAAGISEDQVKFITAWLKYAGDLVGISENLQYQPHKFTRMLGAPAVFRVLQAASERFPYVAPPVPTKEELMAAWGTLSRMEWVPERVLAAARQELAKLGGYYPDNKGKEIGGVTIIITDPYARGGTAVSGSC